MLNTTSTNISDSPLLSTALDPFPMPRAIGQGSNKHSHRVEPYPGQTMACIAETAVADFTPSSDTAQTIASPSTERASAAWSDADDTRLMTYRAQNMNWGAISHNFSEKSGNACRKRHERLVEKKNAQGWDGVRLADLATAYQDCREIMWKMVADKVGGEKWQTIEQKCMEKGLKTLQAAARASRRTQHSSHSLHSFPIAASPISQHNELEHGFEPSPFRDSNYHELANSPDNHVSNVQTYQGSAYPSQHNTAFYGYANALTSGHSQTYPPPTLQHHQPQVQMTHSRRPSGTHSSRSSSHAPMSSGGSLQPAPQMTAAYNNAPNTYFANPAIPLPSTLASHINYSNTSAQPNDYSQHHAANQLPSIGRTFESGFNVPRLSSIIGTS